MKKILIIVAALIGLALFLGILRVEPFATFVQYALVLFIGGLAAVIKSKPDVTKNEEKIKEDAREKVLAKDPNAVVDSLDDRTKSGIDSGKQAGIAAGTSAGVALGEALLHPRSGSVDKPSVQGGVGGSEQGGG